MASDDEDFFEEFDDDDIFWVEESDPTAAVRLLPTSIVPTPRTNINGNRTTSPQPRLTTPSSPKTPP
jgi:hypothetical protein